MTKHIAARMDERNHRFVSTYRLIVDRGRASAFKDGWQVGGPDEGLSSNRTAPLAANANPFLRLPRSRC